MIAAVTPGAIAGVMPDRQSDADPQKLSQDADLQGGRRGVSGGRGGAGPRDRPALAGGREQDGDWQGERVSARTVGRYVDAAVALGVRQDGGPPDETVLAQMLCRNHAGPLPRRETPTAGRLTGHEERVASCLRDDHLQLTRIHELLLHDGVAVSYTALRRYVREAGLWKQLRSTVRMAEWPPGRARRLRPPSPGGDWMNLESDLVALLRRFKLGKVLPTLPDRLRPGTRPEARLRRVSYAHPRRRSPAPRQPRPRTGEA